MFGFPIPGEWSPRCYRGMNEAGLELDSYEEGYLMGIQLIEHVYEEVCDEVWPEGLMSIGILTV